jgi:O-antigen/teichoic acid export membrane protein
MGVANRVVFNTGILYFRMLITIGISFYSTRLILNVLGKSDYGLFSLIAGIIVMLSFLNTAMATSTQRFLSFHKGKDDEEMQKKIFSNSLYLHIGLGVFIVALLELAGLFLFDGFLNISPDRISVAKTIYHYMSATVFFSIIAVPYTGSLNANEDMFWIAAVNITETILKLIIALLLYVISGDKLVSYGLLTAGIGVISFIMYAAFCYKKYPECVLRGSVALVDKKMMTELTSFAGWTLFASVCAVARTQGTAMLLNVFFGTINTAYGISSQISAQLRFFSATLLRVINPQIMASEGANDRGKMLKLSMVASKFGFFLMAIFSIPCIFEMPGILKFWLHNVPENTVIFSRLILLSTLINQLTIGLQSAAQATGKIKYYQLFTVSILLFNLPLSYVFLKMGFEPYWVMITFCIIDGIACISRLYFLKSLAGMSIAEYSDRVFKKEVIPVALCIGICWAMVSFINIPFRFLITVGLSSISFAFAIYYFGLCEDEKTSIDKLIKKSYVKLSGKNNG